MAFVIFPFLKNTRWLASSAVRDVIHVLRGAVAESEAVAPAA